MKRTAPFAHLLLALLLLISACSSTQTEHIDAEKGTEIAAGKVLIVYLSRTKNTKMVAEMTARFWKDIPPGAALKGTGSC